MFCAGAVYKDNSFSFVKENSNRRFHRVTHIVAFGDYKLVFLESPNSEQKSLEGAEDTQQLAQSQTG